MYSPVHRVLARHRMARVLLVGGVFAVVAGLVAIDLGLLLFVIGPVAGVRGASVVLSGMAAVGAGVLLLWLSRRLAGKTLPPAPRS